MTTLSSLRFKLQPSTMMEPRSNMETKTWNESIPRSITEKLLSPSSLAYINYVCYPPDFGESS
jgi:hypothetical protein